MRKYASDMKLIRDWEPKKTVDSKKFPTNFSTQEAVESVVVVYFVRSLGFEIFLLNFRDFCWAHLESSEFISVSSDEFAQL